MLLEFYEERREERQIRYDRVLKGSKWRGLFVSLSGTSVDVTASNLTQ